MTGTPIRSEQEQNQEGQTPQEENVETQPSSQDSTNAQPQNPSNPAGNTDTRTEYISLLEQQLRRQDQEIQRLQDAGARPASSPPATPPLDPDAARQQFYNDPPGITRTIVQEELQRTISPLLEYVRELKGGTEYDRVKARVKLNPQFASHWTPDIEAALDQVMQNVPAEQVNENTIRASLIQVIGMKSMGLLPNSSSAPPQPVSPPQNPAPTNGNPPLVTPPHLRPSAPPGPQNNNQPTKKRQLTELEKRLARENNLTDEQYLEWLTLPAKEVATSNIGRAK